MTTNEFLYILPKPYYFSQGRCGRVSHALGVIKGLAQNNIKVTVITGKGLKDYKRELPKTVRIVEISQASFLVWNCRLIRKIKEFLSDNPKVKRIILRYGFSNFFLFLPLLRNTNQKKWIIEVNSLAYHQLCSLPDFLRKIILFIETFVLNRADFIYVVSERLKLDIQPFIKNKDKILVIPNAASKEIAKEYSFENNDIDNLSRGIVKFIYLGKLHKYYDFGMLIKAFKKINKKYKDIELHFYGDGSMEKEMKLLVAGNKKIIFHGRYDLHELDLSNVFKNAVLIIPYRPNSLAEIHSPIKLFEYMSFGVPIIASSVGQIKNILCHKKTALLYDPKDINSLIFCFKDMISNPYLRLKLAVKSKEDFFVNHTWERRMKYFCKKIL